MNSLRQFAEWLGSHGTRVLGAVLAIVLAGWGFIELADEVREGETQDFDEWVVRSMRRSDDPAQPIGPEWLAEVGRDITALGGAAVILMLTLTVVGHLIMQRKYHSLWLLIIATVGGLLLSSALKGWVDRDRPEIVPHLSYVVTSSFPSGHSMLSAVVYLTLGSLLAGLAERRSSKIYFLVVALLLTLLVGVSRVYMGVHYPTDVLAGWAAGLAWALLCWVVARKLRVEGKVEPVDAD